MSIQKASGKELNIPTSGAFVPRYLMKPIIDTITFRWKLKL